jgi:LuxR family maltose regulon positive regulatory protein
MGGTMMNTDIHSSQIIFYGNRSNSIAEQKGNLGLAYPCTKFFIPQMQNTIANRDTLLKKLDFILSKKLSLVLSPAGYGKTTMLSSWIYKRDYKSNVLWITLDTRDDSLYSFWHCIIFGLYKQMDSCFEDCMNLFYAYSLYPIESIVNLLINSLAKVNNDILIVLDDFHYIQNIDILSSMKSFINRIPRNTHIILVSRYMPDIPISKLIIQDEVIELTIDDLKLSIDEIGDLLNNRLNLCLNDLEIKDLYCHTEGWITPIKLVADSLMKNPERRGIIEHLNSSYKCLDDFLFDEILNEYPAEVQHFLLKTSILETLNPALCNYILNMDNTGKILVNLMNNHLFIFSLDSNEENFRYHSLFAEILRKRLSSNILI